ICGVLMAPGRAGVEPHPPRAVDAGSRLRRRHRSPTGGHSWPSLRPRVVPSRQRRETRRVRNERLRRAMLAAGLSVETLAERSGSSTKSERRWLDGSAVPYPRTRYRVASVIGEDESYLWPDAVDAAGLAGAELVATWPRRSDVPARLWTDLLRGATRSVDV